MGVDDLISLHTRPDFKEITTRGGSSKSVRKREAQMVRAAQFAMCKHCNLDCEFRDLNISNNGEAARCCVPNLRGHAKLEHRRVVNWNDSRIKEYMSILLDLYVKWCLKDESNEVTSKKIELEKMRRLNTLFHRLSDFKELYEPPVQKNVNLNINTTADQVMERLKNWKRKQIEEETGLTITEEKKEEEEVIIEEQVNE